MFNPFYRDGIWSAVLRNVAIKRIEKCTIACNLNQIIDLKSK